MNERTITPPDPAAVLQVVAVYTVKEAAAILRIDPRTVRALFAGGRLPGFKVGHAIRLGKSGVHALVQGTPAGAPQDPLSSSAASAGPRSRRVK